MKINSILFQIFFCIILLGGCESVKQMDRYTDSYNVRYTVVKKLNVPAYDFIFLPGGPGADSSYFFSLTDAVKFPGNCYFLDLPGNGDHIVDNPDYDQWLSILEKSLKQFNNPVVVAHSFGGILTLMCKELKPLLKGVIILDSAPSFWVHEAVKYAKNFDVPDLTEPLTKFNNNPNQENFESALKACMPYYYVPGFEDQYKEVFSSFHFAYQPAVWGQEKGVEWDDYVQWIPSVPTIIINGTHDLMTPYYMFKNDKRFNKPNIKIAVVENAGHLPWIEKPQVMQSLIDDYVAGLLRLN